jgi:hypothetical protein
LGAEFAQVSPVLKSIAVIAGSYLLSVVLVAATDPLPLFDPVAERSSAVLLPQEL